MKKVFSLLFLILIGLCYAFSQSIEVRGIETKSVCIEGCEDGKLPEDCYNKPIMPTIGYELTNTNTFGVSIEVELHHVFRIGKNDIWDLDDIIEDVKYFNLDPNESYVWKPFYGKGVEMRRGYPNHNIHYYDDYYIRCKAFKK